MEVFLDRLKFNEIKEVHLLWSDEAAVLYTNFPHLTTEDDCSARLNKMKNYYGQRDDHFGPFAIRTKAGGFLGLTGGDAGKTSGEFEIWYFVRRDMWGKKIATTAVTHLLEIMKSSGRVARIKATAVVDNQPSWSFLEKLGFVRNETLPKGHKKTGMDLYVYSRALVDS